ncbi:MAG: hypothetical protein H7A38_00430 [Chlamydiales bacterium]|nr:hypothetical protein [Chlamydiales bacterium]
MEQTNFIKFSNDLVKLYQKGEQKVGAKRLQDGLNEKVAHAISLASFVALGYFVSQTGDQRLLGAGFAAGLLFSYMDPTCGSLSSLTKGAVFPMDQKGYFAFQKVCSIAVFLGKDFALPTGFFAGNAFYHYVATAISAQ